MYGSSSWIVNYVNEHSLEKNREVVGVRKII